MSWLNRKPRNRRLGREHVLDVKLRSGQVRQARFRFVSFALVMTIATFAGFFLLWRGGQWALDRLIYENKAFSIQAIHVETDGVIAINQLRRWSGVKPGENLLAIDMARVKRDLEMISAIRSVAVERIMPHTLRLRVAERTPLAQVATHQLRSDGVILTNVVQLDEDGFVMNLLEPDQRAKPATTNDILPAIAGLDSRELIPGRRAASPQAQAALQLIAAFDNSPMSGLVDLVQVDVSSPDILQALTSQQCRITFSMDDFDRQLRRWREIHDLFRTQGRVAAAIDLSVPSHIPVRTVDAATVPANPPRNRNTPPPRRRHV